MQYPMDTLTISYPTTFTSTLPLLGSCIFSKSFWHFAIPLGQLKLFYFILFKNEIHQSTIQHNLQPSRKRTTLTIYRTKVRNQFSSSYDVMQQISPKYSHVDEEETQLHE